jgi:hypothetical protein
MVRLAFVFAFALVGCAQALECTTSRDCLPGYTCVNSVCEGPPCSADVPCEMGTCVEGRCTQPDSGTQRADAGLVRDDGGDRRDARAPIDAGTDAGPPPIPDSGPPCECTPFQTESLNCGSCGTTTRQCGADCRWGGFAPCTDTDARCADPAPYCIADYCWGYRIVHETGATPSSCIDFSVDYLPGDAGALGSFDIQVFGRPGASWSKENRYVSCGGSFAARESGTLNAFGTDDDPVFVYGASDCSLVFGTFESRVHITDPASGSTFYIPNIVSSTFYNSTCTSDRNTCFAASSYCVPL